MLSGLATKIALKRVGLSSNALDFSSALSSPSSDPEPNKLRKSKSEPAPSADEGGWGSWMSMKSLPLTAHAWFSPPPPPVAVAQVPRIGSVAPLDRDRKLEFGGGRRVLVVFLRCAGCAFAQKTFLNLRTLANRYAGSVTCIAVSHSSPQATRKWIDLMGGAWNVHVVVDEDRAIYAAWGLGVAGTWHLFNPTTQIQGWREAGWLGEKVAGSIQKKALQERSTVPPPTAPARRGTAPTVSPSPAPDGGTSMAMGNKWQESGAFAIDGRGTVIWGGKALRADDVMELEEGAKLLAL